MRFLSTLALAATIAVSASAYASPVTSYNAVNDFSTSSNPNGAWTYGTGAMGAHNAGSGFTAFTVSGSSWDNSGYAYWAGTSNGLPVVGYNTTGAMPGTGGLTTVSVPQSELWMHPGSDPSADSIILFTAPAAGTYYLNSEFTGRSSSGVGNGVIVGVYLNGVLLNGATLNGTFGDSSHFRDALTLAAGDVHLLRPEQQRLLRLGFDRIRCDHLHHPGTGFAGTARHRPPRPCAAGSPQAPRLTVRYPI